MCRIEISAPEHRQKDRFMRFALGRGTDGRVLMCMVTFGVISRPSDKDPRMVKKLRSIYHAVARQNWLKSCDSSLYVGANLVKIGELP